MSGSVNAQYNVGSDTVLTVISNGVPLISQILTSFEARQITTDLKSVAIDGVNRYRHLEEGWEGDFNYDRADSTLDDFFAAKEQGRYTAGTNPPIMTISETTTNPDGSTSRYRYDGVTVKLDTIGARKGDSKVEQRMSFRCSRRVKVS